MRRRSGAGQRVQDPQEMGCEGRKDIIQRVVLIINSRLLPWMLRIGHVGTFRDDILILLLLLFQLHGLVPLLVLTCQAS